MNLDKINDSKIRASFQPIPDALNATIGQPDFEVPRSIKDAIIQAIDQNKTGYTQTNGIAQLQEKIIHQYTHAQSCIVTSGASAALFLAFNLLEGEVIVIEPYFVSYPELLKYVNVTPVFVSSLTEISKNITSKTSAIIINSPNNPTGQVYSHKELLQVVEIARRHNIYIISDEVYRSFDYDSTFVSIGDLYEKSIVIDGWSKKFALTGLRIGYLAGRTKDMEALRALQQFTFVCAPHSTQVAINSCFDTQIDITELKKKRDFIAQELKDLYQFTYPRGAFYFYLFVGDEEQFYQKCIEHKLLVVKGSAFSQNTDHIRISFALSWDKIRKMCHILKLIGGPILDK
ncbi:MAG: pyridoxal phosphate-dependent aminotransferase [Candidatus Woesearchaeota archaeon]